MTIFRTRGNRCPTDLCYFNLVSAQQTIIDEQGFEVTDPEEARTEVLKAATEIIQAR